MSSIFILVNKKYFWLKIYIATHNFNGKSILIGCLAGWLFWFYSISNLDGLPHVKTSLTIIVSNYIQCKNISSPSF